MTSGRSVKLTSSDWPPFQRSSLLLLCNYNDRRYSEEQFHENVSIISGAFRRSRRSTGRLGCLALERSRHRLPLGGDGCRRRQATRRRCSRTRTEDLVGGGGLQAFRLLSGFRCNSGQKQFWAASGQDHQISFDRQQLKRVLNLNPADIAHSPIGLRTT
jgi:hypothetical protein